MISIIDDTIPYIMLNTTNSDACKSSRYTKKLAHSALSCLTRLELAASEF